jgi:hypothetical protein
MLAQFVEPGCGSHPPGSAKQERPPRWGKPVHKGVDVISMPLFLFIPYL